MRNYKNESRWAKEKYDEIRAKINKDLGARLRQKLKKENRSIAGWVTDNATEYLGKE